MYLWWSMGYGRSDNSGAGNASSAAAAVQYVWDLRYIDAPVLRDRDSDADGQTGGLGKASSGLDERLFYCTDGNFNVTGLVSSAGAVAERCTYDCYGKPTLRNGSWTVIAWANSKANEILFCGYNMTALARSLM